MRKIEISIRKGEIWMRKRERGKDKEIKLKKENDS